MSEFMNKNSKVPSLANIKFLHQSGQLQKRAIVKKQELDNLNNQTSTNFTQFNYQLFQKMQQGFEARAEVDPSELHQICQTDMESQRQDAELKSEFLNVRFIDLDNDFLPEETDKLQYFNKKQLSEWSAGKKYISEQDLPQNQYQTKRPHQLILLRGETTHQEQKIEAKRESNPFIVAQIDYDTCCQQKQQNLDFRFDMDHHHTPNRQINHIMPTEQTEFETDRLQFQFQESCRPLNDVTQMMDFSALNQTQFEDKKVDFSDKEACEVTLCLSQQSSLMMSPRLLTATDYFAGPQQMSTNIQKPRNLMVCGPFQQQNDELNSNKTESMKQRFQLIDRNELQYIKQDQECPFEPKVSDASLSLVIQDISESQVPDDDVQDTIKQLVKKPDTFASLKFMHKLQNQQANFIAQKSHI